MTTHATQPAQAEASSRDGDTMPLRQLSESGGFGLLDAAIAHAGSGDPYRTDEGHQSSRKPPRRTLDDMRRLSEQIKRARDDQDRADLAATKAANPTET